MEHTWKKTFKRCCSVMQHFCFAAFVSASPVIPKQKKQRREAYERESIVLTCNPPQSSSPLKIHWMDFSKSGSCFSLWLWRETIVSNLNQVLHTHKCLETVFSPYVSGSLWLVCCCFFFTAMVHINQSDRVMTGLDGNLYFSNLLSSDSRDDYICNAQYAAALTILTVTAVSLTVLPSKFLLT